MRTRTTILLSCFFVFLIGTPAGAQDTQTATLEVLQHAALQHSIGSWTLIKPDNTQVNIGQNARYITDALYAGKYTLIIANADGATSNLVLKRNGAVEVESSTPKVTFTLAAGDEVTIDIGYAYTIVGTVSVTSDPAGVPFTLRGPNGLVEKGETPKDYAKYPRGLYSVQYELPEGCPQPQAKSDTLVKESRISFHINLQCDALDHLMKDEYEKKLKFVTMMMNGKEIVLEDVPIDSWFATYVHTMAKTGIMNGYSDTDGNPTGQFGPEDPVSLAQLVKVAHEVAGIDESKVRGLPLRNTTALGTWFENYMRSAESKHWVVFRDARADLSRPATRAEVIATLLQALDVPRLWPTGDVFTDVQPELQFADCIETAAADGVVSTDASTFRPQDPINRAELAKLISLSMEMYLENSPEITGKSR